MSIIRKCLLLKDMPYYVVLRTKLFVAILSFFFLIDFPISIDTIKMDLSILYFKGTPVGIFKNHGSKDCFMLANSADPDEMLHYLVFHVVA